MRRACLAREAEKLIAAAGSRQAFSLPVNGQPGREGLSLAGGGQANILLGAQSSGNVQGLSLNTVDKGPCTAPITGACTGPPLGAPAPCL